MRVSRYDTSEEAISSLNVTPEMREYLDTPLRQRNDAASADVIAQLVEQQIVEYRGNAYRLTPIGYVYMSRNQNA